MKPFAFLARPVRWLLIANASVFAFFILTALFGLTPLSALSFWMVLIPERSFEIWRLVTYAFLHLDPFHFLFNMLMLWMFGDELAQWMGVRRFLTLYAFGGIFAGLISIPFYAADLIGARTSILGASGALFALLVAYARFFPDRQILLFFVFPVRIRYAIWVLIGIDLMLSKSNSGIAHFTHLGGALAGWLYLVNEDRVMSWFSSKKKSTVLTGQVGYLDDQKELDAILAKVSRSGVQSLSAHEIDFLQKASAKRGPVHRGPFR